MTEKELMSISLDLSILMDCILDADATSEETANHAIVFAQQFLKNNPKIKERVGIIIGSFDSDADDFIRRWNLNIEWIKNWEK